MKKIRVFSKTTRFAIIVLIGAIVLSLGWTNALQQFGFNIVNLASNRVEVANRLKYQKNISLGARNVSIGGGGYVTGIYLHPLQPNLVYIKTDIGGFYRWNPNNSTWLPLTEHFRLEQSNYYGGEALALDPKNPDIVYIAAGKYTADWWSHKGSIFKSIDKGETWTKLNIDVKMGGNEPLRWVGERLAVNPLDSNTLFFGSRLDGLWKSLDAGATWHQVTSFPGNLKANIGITAIAFNPLVPGLVYAIAYGDGIYQSTDTGVTWSKIPGSPSESKRMAIANNGVLYVTHGLGVSKFANGVWRNITPLGTKNTFTALSVNPSNPNDVLVSLGETPDAKIYHSIDGGTTWTQKKKLMKNTVPWWSRFMLANPWLADIQFDPQVAGRVWLTDWYGIWRTENINSNAVVWTNYAKDHEELVTFTLVSPPKGPLLLSGVADVDGFYHNNGLDTYPSQTLGPGEPGIPFQDTYSIAYCASAPLQMVRVGGAREHNIYTGATSTDGGLTWKPFTSWQPSQIPMRVAISATNPNLFVVTVSEGQAVRTDDGGATWTKVLGLPDGFKGPWNWTLPITADTVDGTTFYYYASGKVYRSKDGGSSFQMVNDSLPTINQWHSLKALPGVRGEVWLSLDQKGLYRSINEGQTFSLLDQVERAHLFAFGKPQPGSTVPALYLYGKITSMGEGIFRSLDRGKTWTRMGDTSKPISNNPNVMEASAQEFGLVFIGTNGRGIYYGTH